MQVHNSYNGMTGSAGWQAFPLAPSETFAALMASLDALMPDSRFQYVLRTM